MNRRHLKKIDYWIAAWGVIAIALTIVISGTTVFYSALWGAALSLVNWMMLRYLGLRIALAENKLGFGIVMGIKSIAILGIIAASFFLFPIQPLPFAAGISSLFLGIVSYSLTQSLKKGDGILRKENENA